MLIFVAVPHDITQYLSTGQLSEGHTTLLKKGEVLFVNTLHTLFIDQTWILNASQVDRYSKVLNEN